MTMVYASPRWRTCEGEGSFMYHKNMNLSMQKLPVCILNSRFSLERNVIVIFFSMPSFPRPKSYTYRKVSRTIQRHLK